MSVTKFGSPWITTMNIPKLTAEILAAAQTMQKFSKPKKTVLFAGQISTFSSTTDHESTLKTQHLNDHFPVLQTTESGSPPLQFN